MKIGQSKSLDRSQKQLPGETDRVRVQIIPLGSHITILFWMKSQKGIGKALASKYKQMERAGHVKWEELQCLWLESLDTKELGHLADLK